MAIRRNIGGRYVLVRERSSKKGRKGTIMGSWTPPKKKSLKVEESELKSPQKRVKIKEGETLSKKPQKKAVVKENKSKVIPPKKPIKKVEESNVNKSPQKKSFREIKPKVSSENKIKTKKGRTRVIKFDRESRINEEESFSSWILRREKKKGIDSIENL